MEEFPETGFLKADGFDEAITDVAFPSMRLVYSVAKCIEILSQEMTEEEAEEYFYFNVKGAYVGELTPIWNEDNF